MIASFERRADADAAIEALAEDDLPVDQVAIVGRHVELLEEVEPGWTLPRAMLEGAGGGAAVGAIFGFAAGSFNWVEPLVSALALALYGLVLGALAGALMGLVLRALSGRGYESVARLRADRYELVAEPQAAAAARRSLADDRPRSEAHGV